MTARPVRSERTEPVGPVVVVGDTPTARGIRHRLRLLGMTGGEETQSADAAASRFAGARAVVLVGHTGDFARVGAQRVAPRRAALVAGVEQDLADAAAAGVEHVVAISSAMVNGAHPDRPLIADDDPRLDEVDASYAGDVLTFEATIEAMAPAAAEAGMTVTVLRPAVLVGPDIDTLMTRHFEAPRVLTIRGVRREWQLVHVDDVADAVRVVVEQGLGGRGGRPAAGRRAARGPPGRAHAGGREAHRRDAGDRSAGRLGLRCGRAAAPGGCAARSGLRHELLGVPVDGERNDPA